MTIDHNPILNAVLSCYNQLLNVSCVHATLYAGRPEDDGRWTITVSCHNHTPMRACDNTDDGLASEAKKLNVDAFGWAKVPDTVTKIFATEEEIKKYIEEVARLGKSNDIAKFAHPGELTYITKPNTWRYDN